MSKEVEQTIVSECCGCCDDEATPTQEVTSEDEEECTCGTEDETEEEDESAYDEDDDNYMHIGPTADETAQDAADVVLDALYTELSAVNTMVSTCRQSVYDGIQGDMDATKLEKLKAFLDTLYTRSNDVVEQVTALVDVLLHTIDE